MPSPILPWGLSQPPCTIAAVGSGGKTSALNYLARLCLRGEAPVLLTTTTHMAAVQGVHYPGEPLAAILEEEGFLFAGSPAPEGKIGPLPPALLEDLRARAQVTLVEADGSRGLPLKMPAPWEPVLPPGTSHVLVVLGLSCLGKPLNQVCHRWERAVSTLSLSPETTVTPEVAARVLWLAYLRPLQEQGIPFTVLMNQRDAARTADVHALEHLLKEAPMARVSLRALLEE